MLCVLYFLATHFLQILKPVGGLFCFIWLHYIIFDKEHVNFHNLGLLDSTRVQVDILGKKFNQYLGKVEF